LRRWEIEARIDDVLRLVDIGDAIDRRAGTYSGGMRRRLDLAAALVHNPESCSSTNPPPGSIPSAGPGCGTRFAGSTPSSA
jgi:ABC-2 type transport system ATP-binding protein